ncbi:MAG: carbohydrate ABC transporter permease [Chloroflexota bacterium]
MAVSAFAQETPARVHRPSSLTGWSWPGIVAWYALMVALVVVMLFPFYWMVVSSLKTDAELFELKPTLFPMSPSLGFYERLIVGTPFIRYFVNSGIVALVTTGLVIVAATLAAYSLARFRFVGREPFALSMLVAQMFPSVLLAIPIFVILSQLGLLNSFLGLVMAYVTFALPFCTWMLRGHFMNVPVELEESAMIDGATRLGALVRITLPVAAPGIAATAILGFLLAWNEYLFATVLITQDDLKTLPVGLSGYISPWFVDYGVLMAGSVMASVPVIVFFVLVQRYIISGLTAGAVKG